MYLAYIFPDLRVLLSNPLFLILVGFQIWMTVDAVRRQEWIWAVFNFIFPLSAILYFFLVYRTMRAMEGGPAFEWPGAAERERIKQLEDQIHHLDKAHHHAELGEIYQKQGKLDKALASFEAAYARDAEDPDILNAYGQCLIELNEPEKAVPLLEKVIHEDPKFDYGTAMMGLARAYALLNQIEKAQLALEKVLETQTYAEARVQLAEIYLKIGRQDDARYQLSEVIEDDKHAPHFVQKKDRVWTRKARQLLDQL